MGHLRYRLYLTTGDGHITGIREFRSESDEAAIRDAEILRRFAAAELWNRHRRIKVYRHSNEWGEPHSPAIFRRRNDLPSTHS